MNEIYRFTKMWRPLEKKHRLAQAENIQGSVCFPLIETMNFYVRIDLLASTFAFLCVVFCMRQVAHSHLPVWEVHICLAHNYGKHIVADKSHISLLQTCSQSNARSMLKQSFLWSNAAQHYISGICKIFAFGSTL